MSTDTSDFEPARPFFDSVPLPMAVVNRDGAYVHINEAGRRFFRYAEDEVVGRHYRSFVLDRGDGNGAFEAALAGEPRWVRREILRGDGSIVFIDAVFSPLPSGNFLLIARDATAEAQAEERLRASEDLLNRTESISRAGSWLLDLKTDELVWSRGTYELMGYEPGDVPPTRQLLRRSAHADDGARAREALDRMIAGESTQVRHRITRPDGAVRWIETLAAPRLDANGERIAIIGSVRDVTDEVLAAESLERSQRLLHDAERIGHVGSWEEDLVTGDCRWSDEAYRILGREPGSVEPTAASFASHVHPDDLHAWRAGRDQALRGEPASARARVVRTDGEERWLRVGTEPVLEDGAVVRLVGYTQDITEQVAFEQSLRDQQALLQEAERIGRTGSWTHDLEHATVTWSDGTCRIFGFEPGEVEPVPGLANSMAHPDDLEQWREAYGGTIRLGRPMSLRARIIRPDGEVRWVHARGEAVRGADGRTARLIGSMQDVTEEAALEQALRDAATRLERVLAAAPLPIILTDADELIEAINPAATAAFGWTDEEVAGRPLSILCDCDVDASDEPRRARRRDGSTFPVEVTVAQILDGDELARRVVICVDLTEREAREEQVRALQKSEALGTLVAGVAHDFNNLLTAISGSLTMLKEGVPGNWVGLAEDATLRASDLVRRLLQFARGEAAEMSPVDLRQIVDETVGIVRETFDRRVRIEVSTARGLPAVLGNRTQLQQTLLNLLVNARDAVMERALDTAASFEPRINVVLRPGSLDGAAAVELAVLDNGVGIPAEVEQRIFDPFFTTKAPTHGTGLGLAIVASTTRSHGGRISVHARPGGGTEFVLALPVAVATMPERREVEASARHLNRLDGLRTMVVDDEFSLRHIALNMLELQGADVDAYPSAEAVLADFAPGEYDAAVLDLNMPGMNGWELLDRLRELDPGLGIVVLSGYIDEARAGRHRPDQTVAKPYEESALVEAVLAAAERRAGTTSNAGTPPATDA